MMKTGQFFFLIFITGFTISVCMKSIDKGIIPLVLSLVGSFLFFTLLYIFVKRERSRQKK
jgi:predicted PurR-regulated permease PerM